MKHHPISILRGAVLALALLASAIPCAASARSVAPKTRDITISVDGKLDAKDAFVFEGNTVLFRPSGDRYPDKMSVNAMPWPVADKPFELTFAPDFGREVAVESPDGAFARIPPDRSRFELVLGEIADFSEPIKALGFNLNVSVLKDAIPRSPDAVNPPAPAVTPTPTTLPAAQPVGRFPTVVNGPQVVSAIKEPTDGMDHPDYTVTKPVPAPKLRPEDRIVIRGTVAMNAGFRVQGNRLYYVNFNVRGGFGGSSLMVYDGRFASGVTVNGKPWTNLTRPFELDVSLTPTTGKYIGIKAEHCNYDYQFHHDLFEIRLSNKKQREPAPFELTLWLPDTAKQ